MSVLGLPDEELRRLATDIPLLDQILNAPRGRQLAGEWRALHGTMTESGAVKTLPLAFLMEGDLVYEKSSWPAHAVFADTVRSIARLAPLTEAALRAHAEAERRAHDPAHWFGSPMAVEERIKSARPYLTELREALDDALRDGHGLLLWKWEDW